MRRARTPEHGEYGRVGCRSWFALLLVEGDDSPCTVLGREADGRDERADAGRLRIDVVYVRRLRGRRALRHEVQGHTWLVARRVGLHALDRVELGLQPRLCGARREIDRLCHA